MKKLIVENCTVDMDDSDLDDKYLQGLLIWELKNVQRKMDTNILKKKLPNCRFRTMTMFYQRAKESKEDP